MPFILCHDPFTHAEHGPEQELTSWCGLHANPSLVQVSPAQLIDQLLKTQRNETTFRTDLMSEV